jgi:hypothetical protein
VTYLFTRRTRLTPGHGTAGVDWARSVTEKVEEVTGRDLRLWATVYSAGLGTIAWTGWFETLDALERFGDALAADPALEKLTNAASRYTEGGFDDGLFEPIHGTPTGGPTRYVGGATAVASSGSYAGAVAAGVALAERSEAITGVPTFVGRSVTGRDDAITWLTPFEDATAMEAARDKVAADPGWRELLEATRGCFAAGAGMRRTTIYRRLG